MGDISVLQSIDNAIRSIELVEDDLNAWRDNFYRISNLWSAVKNAVVALDSAENAYYDISVQAPEHYPIGHYIAVLCPVIAPLLMPMIAGFKLEYRRYKKLKCGK